MSRKDLNSLTSRQHKDLEQLDGNISLTNPTYDDSQKPELPTETAEDVMTLKLDIEYWTWSEVKSLLYHQKIIAFTQQLNLNFLEFWVDNF